MIGIDIDRGAWVSSSDLTCGDLHSEGKLLMLYRDSWRGIRELYLRKRIDSMVWLDGLRSRSASIFIVAHGSAHLISPAATYAARVSY